jgi:hypothetical protein
MSYEENVVLRIQSLELYSQHSISYINHEWPHLVRVLVPKKPCVMFASKAKAYLH